MWNWCHHHYWITVTLKNMKNENLERLTRGDGNRNTAILNNGNRHNFFVVVVVVCFVCCSLIPHIWTVWHVSVTVSFHFCAHICIHTQINNPANFISPVATKWPIECRDPNKNDEMQRWRWMNMMLSFFFFLFCSTSGDAVDQNFSANICFDTFNFGLLSFCLGLSNVCVCVCQHNLHSRRIQANKTENPAKRRHYHECWV